MATGINNVPNCKALLLVANATEVKLNYTSDTHCALQLVGGKHMKDEGMKGITFHRTEFDYILICILILI